MPRCAPTGPSHAVGVLHRPKQAATAGPLRRPEPRGSCDLLRLYWGADLGNSAGGRLERASCPHRVNR